MTDLSADPPGSESEAEQLFLGLLAGDAERSSIDVEPLCRARPELADELRALAGGHRRLLAGLDALRGTPSCAVTARSGPTSRYVVRGQVAHGGMGSILEVWDAELRRPLAMKVPASRSDGHAASRLDRERRRSRLLSEAQILAQLEHPGIVPVHEVGLDERGEIYFTMQLVRGRSFEEVVELVGTGAESWSLTRAVGVLQRVAEAVAYAHSKGVLHRDLKPANLMVGAFGEAYVMDWGLAKARGRAQDEVALRVSSVDGAAHVTGQAAGGAPTPSTSVRTDRREASESDPASPLLTGAGDVVGTPAYMPPEQASGDPDAVDERSDVYGLGAILYHLLAGAPPYGDELAPLSPPERLERVVQSPPADLHRLARTAPAELVAIAERAMAREPAGRYASMRDLADDLRAYLEGRVVRAHRTGPLVEIVKWGRRHRLAVALLAVLLVTLLASTVTFAALYGTAEQRRVAMLAAQADSIRRQRALSEQSPAHNLPSFQDDFEDGRIDRRWMTRTRPDRIEETGGRLVLHADRYEDTVLQLDRVNSRIAGDFELEVDYRLTGFTVPPGPRAERLAYVMLGDAKETRTQISVHAENESGVTGESGLSYRSMRADGTWAFTRFADVEGRLRLTRQGARITTFYWQDGWRELMSDDFTGGLLFLSLACRNYYDDQPFSAEFDNLTFKGTPLPPGKTLSEYEDDFSDGTIDARLSYWSEAGTVAELEGVLFLEKLEGMRGDAEVQLNPLQWMLRGDFSVAFGLELRRFAAAPGGDVRLSLRVRDFNYVPWGALEVLPEPGGAGRIRLRASYHVEARDVVLEEAPRALRIRRVGSSLFFDYQDPDGTWTTLLERPHLLEAFDMVFWIVLVGQTDEPLLVALDDLEVQSIEER